MSLNFGGLGFSFSGEDAGASKASDAVSNSLDKVWGRLGKVGTAAKHMGSKLKGGMGKLNSTVGRAMGGVSLAVAGAIESAQNPKLDGPFDSMYAQFDKTFNAMTVGMSLSSAESKKMQRVIGSVAHGLNEDMAETAKSWKAFEQQNIDLTKVLGSKGTAGAISDLTKVTAVYGVEGQQLANVMSGLHHGFGMTQENVGRLADKVLAAGKHFGIGQEAIQAWPAIFETLNNELADFGRKAKPEDLDKLTTSIIALGGGLHKSLGGDAASALELSRNIFTTMMGERKNIINMFRGKGGEIGSLAEQLFESKGDVGKVMESMAGDPLKFMESLRLMGAEAEKMGGDTGIAFQRLNREIHASLGANATYAAMGNWDAVKETLAGVPAAMEGSKGAFVDFAKNAHRTGRTAGDSWELMMGRMETRLMRLSGPMRKEWVKDMKKGFTSTIGIIEGMAAQKGPVGKLTQRLLLVKDVGLSALIPAFGKLTPLFGGLATSMLPAMTALGAMGLKFGTLGKMALSGGLLYGLFYLLKNGPEETIKAVKDLGKTIWEFSSNIFPQLKVLEPFFTSLYEGFEKGGVRGVVDALIGSLKTSELVGKAKEKLSATWKAVVGWFKSVDWHGLGKEVIGKIGGVFSSIPWKKLFDKGISLASTIGTSAIKLIKGAISAINWGEVASTIGSAFMAGVIGLGNLAGDLIEAIFTKETVEDGVKTAGIGGVFGNVIVKTLVGAVKAVHSGIVVISGKMWGYFFSADGAWDATKRILKVAGVLFAGITLMAMRSAGSIRGGFKSAIKGIRRGFGMLGKVGVFMALMEGAKQVEIRLKNMADINEDKLIPSFAKLSQKGQESFMGVLNTVDKLAFGIPGKIGEALGISSGHLEEFYHEMVGGMEVAFAYIANTVGGLWDVMWDGLGLIKNAFISAWDVIGATAEYQWGRMGVHWKKMVNGMGEIIDTFWTGLKVGWMDMQHGFENAIAAITLTFAKLISKSPIATEAMRDWSKGRLRDEKHSTRKDRQERERGALTGMLLERRQGRKEDTKAAEAKRDASGEKVLDALKKGWEGVKTDAVAGYDRAGRRIDTLNQEVDDTNAATEDQLRVTRERQERQKLAKKGKKDQAELEAAKAETAAAKAVKKANRKTGGKISSPTERGTSSGSVLPAGLTSEVTSLVGNNAMMARNVANFVKNPIQLQITVGAKSGLRKFLRFDSNLESRAAL